MTHISQLTHINCSEVIKNEVYEYKVLNFYWWELMRKFGCHGMAMLRRPRLRTDVLFPLFSNVRQVFPSCQQFSVYNCLSMLLIAFVLFSMTYNTAGWPSCRSTVGTFIELAY